MCDRRLNSFLSLAYSELIIRMMTGTMVRLMNLPGNWIRRLLYLKTAGCISLT